VEARKLQKSLVPRVVARLVERAGRNVTER
jgi:hypothetical protein